MRRRAEIEGSVAVVTGASSGIGRATACALAERGARVVLAARDEGTLQEAAAECERAGGEALAVPTDVSDQQAVHALARLAIDRFGGIDIWINAAAVMVYGEFADVPEDVYRQVIETNLFGTIHGARAALPYFRERDRGVLVNVASVWGSVTSPYVSPYVVSKFGVRAFSECLQESLWLHDRTRDIHVCTILPQSVDTPIFRHAGNYTGRQAKAVPPVVDPGRVVRTIIRTIEHPRRRRTVGWFGRLLELEHAVMPSFFNRLVPKVMTVAALGSEPVPDGPGNVFEPMPALNRVAGDERDTRGRIVAGAAAAAVAAAVVGLLYGRSSART